MFKGHQQNSVTLLLLTRSFRSCRHPVTIFYFKFSVKETMPSQRDRKRHHKHMCHVAWPNTVRECAAVNFETHYMSGISLSSWISLTTSRHKMTKMTIRLSTVSECALNYEYGNNELHENFGLVAQLWGSHNLNLVTTSTLRASLQHCSYEIREHSPT